MKKGKYTHVQALLAEGNTRREAAEYYNFRDKQVIKGLLKRERRKGRRLAAGIPPHSRGRLRKYAAPRDIVSEQAYKIQRLRVENKPAGFSALHRKEVMAKVKYHVIYRHRMEYPVTAMCRGVSRSSCRAFVRRLQDRYAADGKPGAGHHPQNGVYLLTQAGNLLRSQRND